MLFGKYALFYLIASSAIGLLAANAHMGLATTLLATLIGPPAILTAIALVRLWRTMRSPL